MLFQSISLSNVIHPQFKFVFFNNPEKKQILAQNLDPHSINEEFENEVILSTLHQEKRQNLSQEKSVYTKSQMKRKSYIHRYCTEK